MHASISTQLAPGVSSLCQLHMRVWTENMPLVEHIHERHLSQRELLTLKQDLILSNLVRFLRSHLALPHVLLD